MAALSSKSSSPPGLLKKLGLLLNINGVVVPSSKPPLTTTCVGQLSMTVWVVVTVVVVVDVEVTSTVLVVVAGMTEVYVTDLFMVSR